MVCPHILTNKPHTCKSTASRFVKYIYLGLSGRTGGCSRWVLSNGYTRYCTWCHDDVLHGFKLLLILQRPRNKLSYNLYETCSLATMFAFMWSSCGRKHVWHRFHQTCFWHLYKRRKKGIGITKEVCSLHHKLYTITHSLTMGNQVDTKT